MKQQFDRGDLVLVGTQLCVILSCERASYGSTKETEYYIVYSFRRQRERRVWASMIKMLSRAKNTLDIGAEVITLSEQQEDT